VRSQAFGIAFAPGTGLSIVAAVDAEFAVAAVVFVVVDAARCQSESKKSFLLDCSCTHRSVVVVRILDMIACLNYTVQREIVHPLGTRWRF
jgi:hypothetical protein